MIRGMHSTLYAQLKDSALDLTNDALQKLFEDAYRDEAFVDVCRLARIRKLARPARRICCVSPCIARKTDAQW